MEQRQSRLHHWSLGHVQQPRWHLSMRSTAAAAAAAVAVVAVVAVSAAVCVAAAAAFPGSLILGLLEVLHTVQMTAD